MWYKRKYCNITVKYIRVLCCKFTCFDDFVPKITKCLTAVKHSDSGCRRVSIHKLWRGIRRLRSAYPLLFFCRQKEKVSFEPLIPLVSFTKVWQNWTWNVESIFYLKILRTSHTTGCFTHYIDIILFCFQYLKQLNLCQLEIWNFEGTCWHWSLMSWITGASATNDKNLAAESLRLQFVGRFLIVTSTCTATH